MLRRWLRIFFQGGSYVAISTKKMLVGRKIRATLGGARPLYALSAATRSKYSRSQRQAGRRA